MASPNQSRGPWASDFAFPVRQTANPVARDGPGLDADGDALHASFGGHTTGFSHDGGYYGSDDGDHDDILDGAEIERLSPTDDIGDDLAIGAGATSLGRAISIGDLAADDYFDDSLYLDDSFVVEERRGPDPVSKLMTSLSNSASSSAMGGTPPIMGAFIAEHDLLGYNEAAMARSRGSSVSSRGDEPRDRRRLSSDAAGTGSGSGVGRHRSPLSSPSINSRASPLPPAGPIPGLKERSIASRSDALSSRSEPRLSIAAKRASLARAAESASANQGPTVAASGGVSKRSLSGVGNDGGGRLSVDPGPRTLNRRRSITAVVPVSSLHAARAYARAHPHRHTRERGDSDMDLYADNFEDEDSLSDSDWAVDYPQRGGKGVGGSPVSAFGHHRSDSGGGSRVGSPRRYGHSRAGSNTSVASDASPQFRSTGAMMAGGGGTAGVGGGGTGGPGKHAPSRRMRRSNSVPDFSRDPNGWQPSLLITNLTDALSVVGGESSGFGIDGRVRGGGGGGGGGRDSDDSDFGSDGSDGEASNINKRRTFASGVGPGGHHHSAPGSRPNRRSSSGGSADARHRAKGGGSAQPLHLRRCLRWPTATLADEYNRYTYLDVIQRAGMVLAINSFLDVVQILLTVALGGSLDDYLAHVIGVGMVVVLLPLLFLLSRSNAVTGLNVVLAACFAVFIVIYGQFSSWVQGSTALYDSGGTLVLASVFLCVVRIKRSYAIPACLVAVGAACAVNLRYSIDQWGYLHGRAVLLTYQGLMQVTIAVIGSSFVELFARGEYIYRRRLSRRLEQIKHKSARREELLEAALPRPIARRLGSIRGGLANAETIAEFFDDSTVVFASLVGFATATARFNTAKTVQLLNEIFAYFDDLCEGYGLEKFKTIGTVYMAVAGVPVREPRHAMRACDFALGLQRLVARLRVELELDISLKVGIHSGSLVAGVIGKAKISYDVYGNTVNLAARMYQIGTAGEVTTTETVARNCAGTHVFEPAGERKVKGKGLLPIFHLVGVVHHPGGGGGDAPSLLPSLSEESLLSAVSGASSADVASSPLSSSIPAGTPPDADKDGGDGAAKRGFKLRTLRSPLKLKRRAPSASSLRRTRDRGTFVRNETVPLMDDYDTGDRVGDDLFDISTGSLRSEVAGGGRFASADAKPGHYQPGGDPESNADRPPPSHPRAMGDRRGLPADGESGSAAAAAAAATAVTAVATADGAVPKAVRRRDRFGPFLLSFKDKALEDEFREKADRYYVRYDRFAIGFVFAFVTVYGLLDYFLLFSRVMRTWVVFAPMLGCFGVALVLAGAGLARPRWRALLPASVFVLWLAFAYCRFRFSRSFATYSALELGNMVWIQSVTLITCNFFVVQTLWVVKVVLAVVATGGEIAVLFVTNEPNFLQAASTFCSVVVFCLVSSYILERDLRRWFHLKKTISKNSVFLRDLNAQLQHILANMLPDDLVRRLLVHQRRDETSEAALVGQRFSTVGVLAVDMVSFTKMAAQMSALELVRILNIVFTAFDALAARYSVVKIKTIGDAYLCISNCPSPLVKHAERLALLALDMVDAVERISAEQGLDIRIRLGLDVGGSVIAGVIGRRKFMWDVWGTPVDVAQVLESNGEPSRLHVTARARHALGGELFNYDPSEYIATIDGKDDVCYFVTRANIRRENNIDLLSISHARSWGSAYAPTGRSLTPNASTSHLAAVDRFDAIGRVENKFLDIGSTRDRRDSTDMIASRFV